MSINRRADEARHAIDQIFTGFASLAGALQGLDGELADLTREPADEHYRDPEPEPAQEWKPVQPTGGTVQQAEVVEGTPAEPEHVEEQPEPTPEPEPAEPTVTLEDVRARMVTLTRAGHTDKVRDLIQNTGATKLTEVPEDKYAELLDAAKEIQP